jgi:hypothetical protein
MAKEQGGLSLLLLEENPKKFSWVFWRWPRLKIPRRDFFEGLLNKIQ